MYGSECTADQIDTLESFAYSMRCPFVQHHAKRFSYRIPYLQRTGKCCYPPLGGMGMASDLRTASFSSLKNNRVGHILHRPHIISREGKSL